MVDVRLQVQPIQDNIKPGCLQVFGQWEKTGFWLVGKGYQTLEWVSCGSVWLQLKLSWQGVQVLRFRLNGSGRQMILRATGGSAFDSINHCGVGSTLSEKLSKVPLISSSKMSTPQCSFNLCTPQNITRPCVNSHWRSLFVAWDRWSGRDVVWKSRLVQNKMCSICQTDKSFFLQRFVLHHNANLEGSMHPVSVTASYKLTVMTKQHRDSHQ